MRISSSYSADKLSIQLLRSVHSATNTNKIWNRLTHVWNHARYSDCPYTKTASHLNRSEIPSKLSHHINWHQIAHLILLLNGVVTYVVFCSVSLSFSTSNGIWTTVVLCIVNHTEVATPGTSLQGIPGGTFHVLKVFHGSISQTGSVWFLSFLTLLYHGASPRRAIPSSSRSPAANFTMNELTIYTSCHHR